MTTYTIALNNTNTKLTEDQYNTYKEISSRFCTLTGSEKQISWANDIRKSFLAALINLSKIIPDAQKSAVVALFSKPTEAKFWIDNRDEFVMNIAKKLRAYQ